MAIIRFVGFLWIGWCTIAFVQNGRYNRTKFNVHISFLFQPRGDSYNYQVTQDSLRLDYNCSLINCKDTILYNVKLDSSKAEHYWNLIKNLHLDTLKDSYIVGIDGLSTLVTIQGYPNFKKSVLTDGSFKHPLIRELVDQTNFLISDSNFRFKSY